MSKEVLSQGEIDSLLEALMSGTVSDEPVEIKDQKKLKVYDFRRPNKFTKEQLRTLQVLHEGYARLLSNFLSGYLRTTITIEVASIGQFTYEEFINSVPTPTVMTIFSLSPLKGTALMETNLQFLFPLIDLQFGGSGDMPMKVRELTDIELSVANRIIKRLLDHLTVTWKDIATITPKIESIDANPHLHQLMSPNDIVAVLTFSTAVGNEVKGLINMCLPYNFLDPVLAKFSAANQFTRDNEQKEQDLEALEFWLGESDVEISVVVGETDISVKDFLQLQVGDVLPLARGFNQDLDMYVDNELKYKVQVGTVGQSLAVQVTSLAEEAWGIV
ncbi:flagellar motor switch protein FliM [Desulfotomaculum nigrificans CO-1-SRB]|uniref:Flagellar motor switch protein FliM n=1 Tax=Desulfotomaculum nigrificans (strain DSM 14880 / VKM B-2319 / CO-1-SRB) TaxID=868595 RepID=F6B7Y0_DESCC|nr:flagellar motor switch protein FliM [Desulfotomaculum nigrificans]AEF94617.1 flagellar motor switch protein FliM [Desulfotomaculum nigrificans CO-1-SRB]